MVSLTKTGVVFLGLTGMLYLGALQSETGLLYLILGVLVGCALLNAVGARRSVKGIELVLPPAITAFEGQKLEEAWLLRNRAKGPVGLVSKSGTLTSDCGGVTRPKIHAAAVTAAMPPRNASGVRRWRSQAVSARPASASTEAQEKLARRT